MIQLLSTRYSRHIACLLSVIILCNLAPVFGRTNGPVFSGVSSAAYPTKRVNEKNNFLPDRSSSALAIKAPDSANKSIAVKKQHPIEAPRRKFIGGPSQPEMTSFKAVGTNNMVNLFTGDFSYNIPLLDVGGYPVNIFYDGGVSMEQEASWVGLGWNINPGTVSRNMRGVPDDFNGEDLMIQRQEMKPNKTWGVTLNADLELVGIKNFLGISIGSSVGISFNNYLGPALEMGLKGGANFSIAGKAGSEKSALKLGVGLGANVNSRSGLTLSPNVSLTASSFANVKGLSTGLSLATSYNSRTGIKQLQLSEQMSYNYSTARKIGENDKKEPIFREGQSSIGAGLASSSISFAKPSYVPALRMALNNEAYAGHFQLGGAIFGVYGSAEVEVYSQKSTVATPTQSKPMVGYLYYQKANNNPNAVMDFTRLNDNEVSSNTPVISAPQYSYDVFSIQGEGVGGSIRAYRNDMGYVRDNTTRSKDNSLSLGVDVGIPGHVGANFNTIKTPTVIGEWGYGNKLTKAIGFRDAAGTFENVYFRNPGETSVLQNDQWNKIGGTELVRFKLGGTNTNPTIEPVLERFSKSNVLTGTTNLLSIPDAVDRKKRTQVTSILTAEEASLIGLDKTIKSYNSTTVLNSNKVLLYDVYPRVDAAGYRKKHHISQINVTEPGGRRYVYGIPVYNITQKDFSFTVNNAGTDEDKVNFTSSEATTLNTATGRDGFIQVTETPAYAHSFLLTGLLSPDYVDVGSDGITEDDLGEAVKFNYTRFADHMWRTPHTSGTTPIASFNAGNRTDAKDDKGMISYGKRESWYLHSIESKTMIALFTVENRNDGKGPTNEYYGVSSTDVSLKRLKKIDLYNKADLKKNGLTSAKPVKTVWFAYSYTLCAGTPDNASGGGKLTLDSVYFTFNGKDRVNKNKYVFAYTNGATGNPAYAFNASDRWGSYKPKTQNPGGMKNGDYPYSIQNKTTADENAGAWALKKVLLPSGGQIEVEYESDDYAFVQNKRAAVMMEIAGLGSNATTLTNKLYGVNASAAATGIVENDYVFIKVPVPCANKTEVFNRYLSGIDQLAFKVSVNMPKGAEFINSYATITDYGVYDATRIWVKVNRVDGFTPLTMTALQYLRERLPGQAFPGYDVSESSGLKQVGEMLLGMLDALKSAFKDPVQYLRSQGKAQTVNLASSFVRVNDPDGYKYGGGQRVKSVRLKDNWQAMTGQYTSEYGQTYNYTTTEVFNGVERTISSGVASYEPSIGGEENPFQTIVQVTNKLPLGPASYGAIEMPMLDAFFPTAVVGYSKVSVRSINKNTDTTKRSRSGIGKQVTSFYTAKDFPVYYNNTSIDPSTDKQEHQSSLMGFFYKYAFDSRALSQGFIIETNDMHGKMKSQASYAENDEKSPVNYTENFYRNTGGKGLSEKFDFIYASQSGIVQEGNMGIDVELMTDTREFSVKSTSLEVQAQVDLFPVIFPFWLPFIWPVSGESENTYRAVTTTKVISYHSILDSVVVIDKASQVSTKNVVYDAETGDVVISRTNNEFDKPVYTVKYPAWWAYSGMGLAYKNIDAGYSGVNFYDGKMINGSFEQNVIESGDELYIIDQGSGTSSCSPPSGTVYRLWAFDKNKNTTSLTVPVKDLVYLDENGKLFTKNGVRFRIVRSGKRNMLESQATTLTMMANPVVLSGSTRKLTINSASKVINASALEYREKWQTDNETVKKLSLSYNTSTCSFDELVNCSGYLEKNINPYLKGITGNFRAWRELVFYSDRTETNPTVATNLPENGFLSNFLSYWNFNTSNNLVPDVANTKWLWKTQVTRYNIKGMELETKNALNVYTAAQYGYHRTLPTALTANSRSHETAYDGFEDNSYTEALNNITNNTCAQKHITFAGITNTQFVNTDTTAFNAHSGKFVLGVKANTTVTKQFVVKPSVPDSCKLQFMPDTVNLGGWVPVSKISTMYRYCGTTLKDSVIDFFGGNSFYVKYDYPFSYNGNNPCGSTAASPTTVVHFFFIPPSSGNYTITNTMATPGGGQSKVRVRPNPTMGALNYSNFMTFPLLSSDREFSTVTDNTTFQCPNNTTWTNVTTTWTYFMCAGKPYEFVFYYTPNPNSWPMCGSGWPYFPAQLTTLNIQGEQLHQAVKQVDSFCAITKPIYATDTMFNPVFTIPANKKMLFSAWVREECGSCESYSNNQVKLQFNVSGSAVVTLKPAGPVIEGWQRYEGEFTAPVNATQMTMSMVNSNAGSMIYFDDIRIHPANANMKSYAYDPVNLRLVAEMDANNYATQYEYDEEGSLIRTKAETKEGIKTINETRSFKQRNVRQVQ